MTLRDELNGVDIIYLPLLNAAKKDIEDYNEEIKQYSSKWNPFHRMVRAGIRRNIATQQHFITKILADYETAKSGASANFKE